MTNTLSLERFRQILGYNPYHFYGLSNSTVPVKSNCNTLVYPNAWNNADAVGREEIKEAITTAENRLFEYLGYRVGPCYVQKELQYPRPFDARMGFWQAADAGGRWLSMDVQEGYIQEIGTEAFTSLDASASVVYSDEYGDGVTDTATLTVDISGSSPTPTAAEIAVFFNTADRLDKDPIGPDYEIRPISASISGTTLTIIIRSWLLVRPIKYKGVVQPNIDPNDTGAVANIFAQTLEVYRRYTKTDGITTDDSQAVLFWETSPPAWALECCTDSPTFNGNRQDPAAVASAIARVTIRDRRLGYLGPVYSKYNTTSQEFTALQWGCDQPDRVKIRYLAGANRKEVEAMLPGGSWDQIVARLAMAELDRDICGCNSANRTLWRWQTDLAQTGGNNDVSFQAVSPEQLNNPFGTRRGAVYAWNQVKNLMLTKSVII